MPISGRTDQRQGQPWAGPSRSPFSGMRSASRGPPSTQFGVGGAVEEEERAMYAVVRRYRSPQLIDELAQNQDAVEALITGIPGFVSYTILRTDDGGITLSVYQDQAGAEESIRQARTWVQANVSAAAQSPAEVSQGEVVLHLD